MSAEKFLRLSELCELMGDNQDNMCMEYSEAKFEATTLACELFPPIAKPLVWDEEPTPFDGVHRYSYGCFCGKTLYQCGYVDGTHYGHFRAGNEIFYAPTLEEVKAACEAHHQAKFLELLA